MIIKDKKQNYFPARLFLFLLMLYFGLLSTVFASEGTIPSVKQKSFVHYGTNLILEKVIEDTVFISGEKYIYTNKTHLLYRDQLKQGLTFSEISSPYLVDLVYRQYSVTTEAVSYDPGTRIIEKLTIIEKIDPATLNSVKKMTIIRK